MKRIATLLVALVIGAGALPAGAMPGAGAGAEQLAAADWIVMQGRNRATMYFAIGWRMVSDYGVETIGAVGKGKCKVSRGKHFMSITCYASGRGKRLGFDQFEYDPALRSASFDYKFKGERQRASWRGRGRLPYTGAGFEFGDSYAAVGAGMARGAHADAHIFGRKMVTRGMWSFAYLGQGAGVVAFANYGRSVTQRPDGSFTYRIELRLPRR